MSKYMQLTVKVRAHYQESFGTVYPKIASHLSRVDEALVDADPSLFDLVGKLDKLLYVLDGNPAFKEILTKNKNSLVKLAEEIQGHIAGWELAKADKALYTLEDVFDEIEWELDNA
ncbi:MAG: hypothetical protein WCB15_28985 [Desulfobacterales bacterium]